MDIVLRAATMFVVLFVLLRLLGQRELAEMTPFDMVVLIVMGDLIQQAVTHTDSSITGAVLAVATFAFLALVLSWTGSVWPRARVLLEGRPQILVQNGEVYRANMRRNRVTRDDLEAEMRGKGITHLDTVRFAILETNGRITFIEHSDT